MINNCSRGFSLIELLIVLGIMAILAAAASSYFGDNVKSARCTEGRAAILSRSTVLEKCKAIYGVYNNNCDIELGATTEGHFDITLARTDTSFTLTATAGGTAGPSNPFCSTITINELGVQGGTGSSPW